MWKTYVNLPRPVYVLCLGTFINRVGTLLIPFLTLYVTDELGLGTKFATAAMGAFGMGALFAAILGGHLTDLIGRRPVMLIALFGGAAILFVYPLLRAPWAILVAIAIYGLVADMYRPATMAMLADICTPEERTHAFGLVYFSINLGFAVGPAAGGYLADFSFKWLIWIDALTAAAFGLVVVFGIAESMPSKTDLNEKKASDISFIAALKHILRDRVFMPFCVGTALIAVVYMQAMSTLPIYLNGIGIGSKQYGLIISLNGVMIVLLQLPMTSFISRFHRGNMLVTASVLTALGYLLKIGAIEPWHFAAAICVWTLGEIMAAPLTNAITSDLAPKNLRGRYMGMLSICFSGALMVGAPVGGLILDSWGGQTLWICCGMLSLAAAVLQWTVRTRLARRPDPVPGA